MQPKFSIITPSYNQGKYLERTIQSVLSQDIPQLEYVVMDGGSQDETLNILKRYSKQLRYVSESDRGQAHAVNKGIMMTSGDIIGWLNSDDVYYAGSLNHVLDFFDKNPNVDVLYGQALHINQQDQVIESYPTENWNLPRLKQACFISQPAVFFRRHVIEKSGLLNEKLNFCMDYEYWLRLALNGAQFHYCPHVLAGSRLYPETKTVSSPEKVQLEVIQMLRDRLGYVPITWLLGSAIRQVKAKTNLRKPQLRYGIAVFFQVIREAFRWNGIKGLWSCLELPKAMWSRVKH